MSDGKSTVEGRQRPTPIVLPPNLKTVDFVRKSGCLVIAEVGVGTGSTSLKLAECLAGRGELHLFDFDYKVQDVKAKLNMAGHENVIAHPNSQKLHDSYNWSLMRLLQARRQPMFDYVFLDGAHTWGVDALAFLLLDRLLKDRGYIDFDDYNWSLGKSPTMNPKVRPQTATIYTAEQMEEPHVHLIVDILVRRDPRYVEVVPNKIFQKAGAV